MDPTSDATLAILAGGRGSRMGGAKDRLTVAGRPVLVHLLEQARHDGPTLLITSPEHPRPIGWERFDRVAFDPVVGEGPLAGILAGLVAATTPIVCFLSVDMPGVGFEQVRWLRATVASQPATAGLLSRRPRVPGGGGGVTSGDDASVDRPIVEPFPSLFRPSLASPLLRAHWAAGRRSLRSLLALPSIEAVDVPAGWLASVWTNLNYPEDLSQAGVKMG